MHAGRERRLDFTRQDFGPHEAGTASVWGLVAATAAVAAVTIVFLVLTAHSGMPPTETEATEQASFAP